MKLIGMLDSPYVRRTAISLRVLKIAFEHRSISVFSTFEQFRQLNPVVKAPTLICDDGTVLMDSALIIAHLEHIAGRSLMPTDLQAHRTATRRVGLALVACEKAIQIVYERQLRPAEKQHEPWVDRVRDQLLAAIGALEAEYASQRIELDEQRIDQAAITTAVAWRFTQEMLPTIVRAGDYRALAALGEAAEKLPAFVAAPFS